MYKVKAIKVVYALQSVPINKYVEGTEKNYSKTKTVYPGKNQQEELLVLVILAMSLRMESD